MKVIYTKNGKGYLSPRITLSKKILKTIGVSPDEPYVNIYFNEQLNCIIITKDIDKTNKK